MSRVLIDLGVVPHLDRIARRYPSGEVVGSCLCFLRVMNKSFRRKRKIELFNYGPSRLAHVGGRKVEIDALDDDILSDVIVPQVCEAGATAIVARTLNPDPKTHYLHVGTWPPGFFSAGEQTSKSARVGFERSQQAGSRGGSKQSFCSSKAVKNETR